MGMVELLVVLIVVLLFFGASRLPALGEGLGKALKNLKSAVTPRRRTRRARAAGARGGELPPGAGRRRARRAGERPLATPPFWR